MTTTLFPAPALSVVVPSVNGWEDLEGCLAALAAEAEETPLEILVPDRVGEALRERVRAAYPAVRVLPAGPETTIPALRALAFEAATAPAVAVIEDHVLVPRGWARQLLAALERGEDVAGGAVENAATESLVDWAAFLCEYSQLVPPVAAGEVAGLAGNNVVYRREVLRKAEPAWRAGRWEDHLHAELRRLGVRLHQHPEIVVGHRKRYTVGEYLAQRFLYARAYAGLRVAEGGAGRRALYGALALALPPVLFVRIVRTLRAKRRHGRELGRSLPLLFLFTLAWGLGEVTGAWFGEGGALKRIR